MEVEVNLVQALNIRSERDTDLMLGTCPRNSLRIWVLWSHARDDQGLAAVRLFDDLSEEDHLQMETAAHCFLLLHIFGFWITVYLSWQNVRSSSKPCGLT